MHRVTSGVFRNFSTVFLLITEYLSIMSHKSITNPSGGGGGGGVQGRVRVGGV